MSDSVDIITNNEDNILAKTITSISANANKRELVPCGICYNCEERVEGSKLFCDEECRDEYEHYISCLKRNGNYRGN